MRTLSIILLCGAAAAQVPDGWYLVSSFANASATPGGLFLVHPRIPGPPVVVQGLASSLTGVGAAVGTGANCVAIRPDDQVLLVGSLGQAGTPIDLHEIALIGSTAQTIRTTNVGTVAFSSTSGGGINQIAVLPSGDAVFCVGGLRNTPPLGGAALGYFSRATGAVTPIPTPAIGGQSVNAVAVDRSATTIYAAVLPVAGSPSTDIHALPLTGGTSTLIATLLGGPGLAVDSTGRIYAGSFADIVTIDPASGVVSLLGTVGANVNGLALEAATDLPVCVLNGSLAPGPGAYWQNSAGAANLLTAGITGVGSGMAVLDDPRAYGTSTAGTANYLWRTGPAPGGLPTRGNAGFSLQVDGLGTNPGPGFLAGSTQPANQNLFGVRVLLNPGNTVLIGLIAPGTPLAAPIPSSLGPGLRFYFQSFHLDAGAPQGLAASNGQLVGIL